MSNFYQDNPEEDVRREEFNNKIARMRREKEKALRRRQRIIRLAIPVSLALIIAIVLIVTISLVLSKHNKDEDMQENTEIVPIEEEVNLVPEVSEATPIEEERDTDDIDPSNYKSTGSYIYEESPTMTYLAGDNMQSANAILVNVDSKQIVGQVDYKTRIIPASMTKVMTVLVAAENIDSIKDKVAVSIEATDFAYKNDCSSVGFAQNEEVTIEDLFYGTILCSGGDAAAQLAIYVAGSQEAFVDMMNQKCEELGISSTTHFTNTVGIYNDNHYSTCYDMAIIMNAAIENDFVRTVMSAKKYTTSSTAEHPDGISISNWFLRRIEDKDCGGNVVCAKTGFVVQSGNCAVSYYESATNTPYICVTANAHSGWRAIYDHVDIYKNHTK